MNCTLTYLGSGECSVCRISLKPQLGQELRLQHTNSEGVQCSLHCAYHRQVEPDTDTENPSADFSQEDGW